MAETAYVCCVRCRRQVKVNLWTGRLYYHDTPRPCPNSGAPAMPPPLTDDERRARYEQHDEQARRRREPEPEPQVDPRHEYPDQTRESVRAIPAGLPTLGRRRR